jgi:4-amino-4-deoxy-L-arabinose transferase-like glycosyltransferase
LNRTDWLVTGIAALLFAIAAAWDIHLPGLQYDECADAAPAVNFVEGTTNTRPMQIDPSVIHVFGRQFPLMIMTYIGPVKGPLYIPFFFLFGISTVTVRFLPILVVMLCFPLAYLLCLHFFGRTVARIAIPLMVFDPGMVFYLTRDVAPAALQVFFKLLALSLCVQWWKSHKTWLLVLGAFTLGVGVTHKVDFLWVVGGFGVATLVCCSSAFFRRLTLGSGFAAGAAFLAGASPIVAINVLTGGTSFAPFVTRFVTGTGLPRPPFLESLLTRLSQIANILNGEHLAVLYTSSHLPAGPFLYVAPAVLVFSVGTLFPAGNRQAERRAPVRALWMFVGTVLFVSCFSPTVLHGHHLMALFPFLHIVMGVFLVQLSEIFPLIRQRSLHWIAAGALCLSSLVSTSSVYAALQRTGGTRFWSDSIYPLNEYLVSRNEPVIAMDWGFTLNLLVLSKGTLHIDRAYLQYWNKPVVSTTASPFIAPGRLYLCHTRETESFAGSLDAFLDATRAGGFTPREESRFSQRDGRVVSIVYRVVPTSIDSIPGSF